MDPNSWLQTSITPMRIVTANSPLSTTVPRTVCTTRHSSVSRCVSGRKSYYGITFVVWSMTPNSTAAHFVPYTFDGRAAVYVFLSRMWLVIVGVFCLRDFFVWPQVAWGTLTSVGCLWGECLVLSFVRKVSRGKMGSSGRLSRGT